MGVVESQNDQVEEVEDLAETADSTRTALVFRRRLVSEEVGDLEVEDLAGSKNKAGTAPLGVEGGGGDDKEAVAAVEEASSGRVLDGGGVLEVRMERSHEDRGGGGSGDGGVCGRPWGVFSGLAGRN